MLTIWPTGPCQCPFVNVRLNTQRVQVHQRDDGCAADLLAHIGRHAGDGSVEGRNNDCALQVGSCLVNLDLGGLDSIFQNQQIGLCAASRCLGIVARADW